MRLRIAVLAAMLAAMGTIFVLPSFSAQPNPAASLSGGAAKAELDKLAAVLRSPARHEQKLLACKRLALIGGRESVPVLAPLLTDEKLSHAARIALEAIPDPAAAEALRNAMSRLQGKLLVGVIHSLGARRDPEAVAGLITRLADADVQIACAAARSLGKIATDQCVAALQQTISTPSGPLRAAAGDGLLVCGDSLVRRSQCEKAAAVYGSVAKADVPKRLRLAATRGEILARGSSGVDLLIEQLKTSDEITFAAAIGVGREIASPKATQAMAEAIESLTPAHQALLLAALADRGDAAARPAVLKAAKSAEPAVRIAAISALATLGDASSLDLLLAAAAESDSQVAAAAANAMSLLSTPGVDDAFVAILEKSAGKSRRVLVEVIGRRRIASAVPALLKAAEDSDSQTRLAALRALGTTVAAEQLSSLTSRLSSAKSPEELAAVREALKAACVRSIDKNACAKKLAACLPQAGPPAKQYLLELLGTIGGPVALKSVAAAASDPNEEVQDAATRILGKWLSPDAAAALADIARKSANVKLRTRALRGYVRIIRQMDVPDDRRLAMCREAMEAARRDEERVLVLEALGRIASPEALAQLVPHLGAPALKKSAASSAVAIAEKIVAAHPAAAADAMRKVLAASPDETIARRADAVVRRVESKTEKK